MKFAHRQFAIVEQKIKHALSQAYLDILHAFFFLICNATKKLYLNGI